MEPPEFGKIMCTYCHGLTKAPQFEPVRGRRIITLAELKRGARSGCCQCLVICTGLERLHPPNSIPNSAEITVPKEYRWLLNDRHMVVDLDEPVAPSVLVRRSPWSRTETIIEFFTKDAVPPLYPGWRRLIGSAAPVPPSTGSEASLRCLEAWLRHCNERHTACLARIGSYTPRRLVDLGPLDEPIGVRLHERTQQEQYSYVRLSYRWSTTPTLQTLKSNIEDHKAAVSWDSLPLAFQQFFFVVRRLGLRYAWIDALCIVQDDENDKALDIKVMDSIFEGGLLTIVSAWAEGPEQGLFGELGGFSHHELPITDPGGVPRTVCVRRQLPHVRDNNERMLPCFRRGWIYQELVLSTRLAFFVKNEITWRCRDLCGCQCHPTRVMRAEDSWAPEQWMMFEDLKSAQKLLQDEAGSHSAQKASLYWWASILQYSGMELTHPSDRLPAIQGLATRMESNKLLGRYIYGMWDGSLLFDMAWGTRSPEPRPAGRRAPTWSWASVNSPVGNHCIHGKIANWVPVQGDDFTETKHLDWLPLADVLEVDTTPGLPVKITLDCPIREVWTKKSKLTDSYHLYCNKSDTEDQWMEFDADIDPLFEGGTDGLPPDNGSISSWSMSIAQRLGCQPRTPLWCAKILAKDWGFQQEEVWLVIKKVKGTRDEYERVGSVKFNPDDASDPFVETNPDTRFQEGWNREIITLI